MGAILLKNIRIGDERKDILIEKGVFKRVEAAGSSVLWELSGDLEVMDCSGKVGIPSFVNMHVHAAMTLMRGISEDELFSTWLRKIWDVEENVDADFVREGTAVACLEMIKTGTTTFADHYWFPETGFRTAVEMGLKPSSAYVLCDNFDPEKAARQKDECVATYEASLGWSGQTPFVVGCHAPYSVSRDLLVWAREFAEKHNLRLHIHLSETEREVSECKAAHNGLTPVEYLDSLGFLSDKLIAAHTLWVSEHDIELLGSNRVNCVHNINSNLKLSSGYRFMYNELKEAGANICIGTDGCASSNNLDMLEAMKTSALLQKAWRGDPAAMPLDELLKCATTNGARALGLNSGIIAEGKDADMTIIETDNSFFLSPGPLWANLIYSSHSDCIDSVICNGRFVMRNREIEGEKEIYDRARKVLCKIA